MAEKNLRINISLSTRRARAAIGSLGKSLRNLKNLFRSSFAAVVRTGVVAGFFLALRNGLRTIQNFKNGLVSLGRQFAQLRLKAAETAGIITGGGMDFGSVFQEAITMSRRMSNQIGRSAIEIQEGMVTAARSGLGLADSVRVTGSAMALAVSNGADFNSTLNDLIATTRAFGVELGSVPQFAEALTQAVRSSLSSLEGLFAGLKRVGAIAATAFGEGEKTFLDTAAALQVLNDAGIQGEKAGTRLRAFMTKLVSQTTAVNSAFSKYGVNIFQANGESQKFLGTLLRGSKAMQTTKETLNSLKDRQFQLVLANKEGTKEYAALSDQIDETAKRLNNLQQGTDEVFNEFKLSGGKLKDFSRVLNDLSRNVPSEVIAKVFGIRGGQAGTTLINNIKKFNDFRKALKEVTEESKKGESILGDIFAKFLQTVQIRFLKLKNTAINIFGEIGGALLEAFGPVLDPLQAGLDGIFNIVNKNRKSFKRIFEGVADQIKPIVSQLAVLSNVAVKNLAGALTPGATINVPQFSSQGGNLIEGDSIKVSGSVSEKFKALFSSLGQLVVSSIKAGLSRLSGAFTFIAELFGEALANIIQTKISLFENIGSKLGAAIGVAVVQAIKRELPNLLAGISNLLGGLGVPESIKIPGPLGFGGKEIPLRFNADSVRQSIANSDERQRQKAGAQQLLGKVQEGGGLLSTSVGAAIAGGFNLQPLSSGSNQLEEMSKKNEKAAQLFNSAAMAANERSSRALQLAEQANRSSDQQKRKLR